ncbi:aldo/keto reductase [Lentzea sp. NPDC051838]|uniref:aldo/keto reductase n=1 Tax=Lentzea sp. NPDC051838 TaxID=3154849 RepID=UPI0034482213
MSLDSYLTLGRSGLRVSPFTLGTMTFGEDHGWGSTPEESAKILASYVDSGGNSIDTANLYTNGHSEKIIGDFLAGSKLRDRLVLATKFFGNLHAGDPNGGGPGRKAMIHQLEDSLRRLRTDYVDLYWLHNFDPATPVEETLRALDDLVRAGKVRYIGFSDVPAWATAHAATLAQWHSWSPIIALQLEHSLLERTPEGELIPMAQAMGMGVMPWSPLRGGFLSGKYTSGAAPASERGRVPSPQEFVVIDAVNEVANELGVPASQVALSWLRGRPGVSSIVIGARRYDQFEMNLGALDVTLTDAQRAKLDEVSAPHLNFPAENNRELAPHLQFAGATVDGRPSTMLPMFASGTRY